MVETMIVGLLAETSVHVGAGQSAGVVDLPVAREGATGLPHVPDTGLKGALRQWAEGAKGANLNINRLFGSAEQGEGGGAGVLLVSTARLLCLPIRRLDGPYAWVTTPYLLERLRRDATRAARALFDPPQPTVSDDQLLMVNPAATPVFLEEYRFSPVDIGDCRLDDTAKSLIADGDLAHRLASQAAIMSDAEFAWFSANALPVDARNSLDDRTKMSTNLWYEETLPPDTLLYALIASRHDEAAEDVARFRQALTEAAYLQVGGNETVGQGWFSVKIVGAE